MNGQQFVAYFVTLFIWWVSLFVLVVFGDLSRGQGVASMIIGAGLLWGVYFGSRLGE